MIEPLTIILLALVGLCLVVMWGYIHRVRLRMDALEKANASLKPWQSPAYTDIDPSLRFWNGET